MTASIILGIILLAVIIAVVAAVSPIMRRLSLRANAMIILGYLSVLIVLSLFIYAIPDAALKTPVDPDFIVNFEHTEQVVAAGIRDGSFDVPEDCLKAVSTFVLTSSDIKIASDKSLPGLVYVGTKGIDTPDDGSGKIDVYSYSEAYVSLGNGIYDAPMLPPSVSFDNAVLSISNVEQKTNEFIVFNDKNTLPQFFDSKPDFNGGGIHSYLAVVVLLPPGVSYSGSSAEPLSALSYLSS